MGWCKYINGKCRKILRVKNAGTESAGINCISGKCGENE